MVNKNTGTHYNLGEENPRAKLTKDKVEQIRERLARGESMPSLARLHGVSTSTINRIKHGVNWRSVK